MNPRDAGLAAAERNDWPIALLLLNQAARRGATDVVTLDALGEAAYRTGAPEALGPYQNHYKYPRIATQMARAFLMLGDPDSCREFLGYASDSALKFALYAMLKVGRTDDLKGISNLFIDVAEQYPTLFYPEFWRALAAIADAAQRDDLTRLAERRSKAWAYKDPNIHFNQALRMLGKGELRAGWRLYDWRLIPGAHQSNRTEFGKMSHWEGESLQGKSILVYLEQGLGDGIFGLRYLRPLMGRGARIEVVARKALIAVIKSSFPEVVIHDEDDAVAVDYWQKTPQTDYWVYAFSIPYRGSLWQPIGTEGFIRTPQDRIDSVANRILNIKRFVNTPHLAGKFPTNSAPSSAARQPNLHPRELPIATINWHGRIDTDSDRTRAFSAEEFLHTTRLLDRPHLIVSVQKDATEAEISWMRQTIEAAGGIFHNAGPELRDFADTAAWIQHSERLWTNDTSVAHLGAGLGHPTTVLVRNKSIWQWIPRQPMGENEIGTALWYDSAEIRYALTPEVSWLFTAMNRNDYERKDAINEPEQVELQPTDLQPSRRPRTFRFAGRNQ
jgi:hypothetical protein